ncbi:ankyrin [Lindgomyces ingoldianus]|uniref:Ankyrin n=1 Tax=Lindgomyces ingoldianus TaxID=673940 RepID=A0ACB6QSZ5_9PLEO|nr:ankyrin [Lindgomyces ingoldianus]KAF2469207.1 ankyrin [Lindgomyces ingoldianus]
MDPLSLTASIIAVLQLSTKVLEYLNDVKDASKDRTQCALETSNLYNLLFNLRAQVEEGDATKEWYTALRALAVENGPLDQFKEALETLQARMTDGGRLKKAGDILMWKFKKEEMVSILGRIERLKTLVEIALQRDHFKLSRAIKTDTEAIKSDLDSVRTRGDNAEHRRLLQWISSTDYPAQQSDIIKRRQEGTGQWFLAAPQVARWLSEPQATLFCSGIPGAGKTILAAIAIDHLFDHLLKSMQSSSHGVAYVYCNYKAREEQDTSQMLAAILKQLVQARPSLVGPVELLHKQHADRGTRPSPDEVFSALRDVLARYSTVYIVIDALDECQDSDGTRRQFLTKLRDLQVGRDVRLMATSRFIPEIVDWFNQALKLEVQASKEDVKRFVAGQICRLPKCIQRNSALQEIVQEKIVEAVDGMFLLARLHTDSLLDKRTVKDVKSTLAKLSKGSAALDHAYKEAIQRIEGQLSGDYELAKKVLSWITYAKRPLTTTEMCCALAVEPDEADLDTENIPDVEDLLSVCAGLVVVDQESAVIRLVHYTTQEYFDRIRDAWDPGAQLYIASTCLTYLSLSIFKTGSCSSNQEFEERLQESQFLDYAAKHWGEHAVTVEDQICELACSFLSHKELVSCAAQVLSRPKYTYQGYSQAYPKDSTGLHLTARFGLPIVLEALLLNQVRETALVLERRDSYGQTLLYLAAGHGHQRMVKLLLDKGADVNAQGGRYGNALHAASVRGHETIVKLLLEAGADVNAQSGRYGNDNALQAASYEGHETI